MSINFLERQVLRRQHQLQRTMQREYGRDAVMWHFDKYGEIENGEVHFQVKATDKLDYASEGRHVRCRVESTHVRLWSLDPMPFILVLYDASKHRAFWLHVQRYVNENPRVALTTAETVTFLFSVQNKLTINAVDHFRKLSMAAKQMNP